MMSDYVCDCEPDVHPDGSRTHDEDCPVFPWCPHEMSPNVCDMPCGCQCLRCVALGEAQ